MSTATPSVVDNAALMDGGVLPTVTSLPPTVQTFNDPATSSSPAVVPSATPTLAQEALSPPQVAQESPVQSVPETAVDQTESAPGQAPIAATLVAMSTVAQSPTPTATPLIIAQVIDSVEARPPRAKIVVDQPPPLRPLLQGEALRIVAWITLLCASLLALFAWRLRRS
jgi:hypothetical protein